MYLQFALIILSSTRKAKLIVLFVSHVVKWQLTYFGTMHCAGNSTGENLLEGSVKNVSMSILLHGLKGKQKGLTNEDMYQD